MARRVVITSMGVISSIGLNSREIIDSIRSNRTSFIRSPIDTEVIISPIKDFNLKDYCGRFKYARYLTRAARFGFASAVNAVTESGLENHQLEKAGLFAGVGPNLDMTEEFQNIKNGNLDHEGLKALWILKYLPNTLISTLSQYFGIHGENLTITNACAASLQSIGEAYRKIKNSYLDTALAGGSDSRINHGGILSYKKAKALYTGDYLPQEACRPFDKNRNGFIPGEGGAFFVLESLENAEDRGAEILAEISGYGASIDGHNMTAPQPDGKFGLEAIESAMAEAKISSEELDLISAHGTSTPLNDDVEAEIIKTLSNNFSPPVTALKSWIGHTAAACGAVELAIYLSCIKDNCIPMIRNLENPCTEEIDFVRKTRNEVLNNILLTNYGFGGQNSALVIKSWR